MAVKPVPLELAWFRPGPTLYDRDEIECPKHKMTKRTHFSVNMNDWALLSDDYYECIWMPEKAMVEDTEGNGFQWHAKVIKWQGLW